MRDPGNGSSDLALRALGILVKKVEEMAIAAEASRRDAQARANEHAGKVESRFDTFREEAQYLACGQALRREELLRGLDSCKRLLEELDEDGNSGHRVLPGSVASLMSDDDEVRHYLIAPAGSGLTFQIDSLPVVVVSPAAPVGKALLRLEVGDEVELGPESGNGVAWVVSAIR